MKTNSMMANRMAAAAMCMMMCYGMQMCASADVFHVCYKA